MNRALANAHIATQAQLRSVVDRAVGRAWDELPAYNEGDLDAWLSEAVAIVAIGQQQAVRLTDGFLAQAVGRAPLGVPPDAVTGAAARNGTPPAEVYRRPFVRVWSMLAAGTPWEQAVAAGRARATSTAALDVQLAMRETLRFVGEEDDEIAGYQRVPDPDACAFCQLIAGMRYLTADLLAVHNRCGCGVDVILATERGDFTGNAANDLHVTGDGITAAIRTHGELGPVLVNAAHDFTSQDDLH